ncbi:hypothetical protein ACWF50_13135 [Brucella pseudogrignonensis]
MAELRAYNPSWNDRIAQLLLGDSNAGSFKGKMVEGVMGSTGLGRTQPGLVDFVPGVSNVLFGDQAVRDAYNGNYKGAALNAVAAVPFGALNAGLSSVGKAVQDTDNIASRLIPVYNPPAKSLRPFEADYPNGAPSDAAGNLTHDIDGRPLTASYVAGRRVVGGSDQAIQPAEVRSIGEETTGRGIMEAPSRSLRGASGLVEVNRYNRQPEQIFLSSSLTPGQSERVLNHEVGHVIDQASGEIPTDGLSRELRPMYNTLNTGQERTKNLTGPEHLGYKGDEIPREHMADAIRAYMSDPNYIKTVAPKTAARIRQFVNDNPKLKDIIQFNSVAAAGGAGALAMQPDDAKGAEMSKFHITAPDGSEYEVEGENQEGALQALQQHLGQQSAAGPDDSARNSVLGKIDTAMRGAADTLSFGLDNNIAAAGDALFNPIFGTGQDGDSFSERYNKDLAQQRGIDQADHDNRFGYRLSGQIGGGLAQGVGLAKNGLSLGAKALEAQKGLMKVAGASALDGAGLGAAQGFGSGEDGFENRLENAELGTLTGLGVGFAAPVAMAGIGGVAKSAIGTVGAHFNPQPYADGALNAMLRRSGRSVDDITKAVAAARDDGQDMFNVADAMGYEGRRGLSSLVRTPNSVRQKIFEQLAQRQTGQGDRLGSALADGFDAHQTAAIRTQIMKQMRKEMADQNYSAAREAGGAVDLSPVIQHIDDILRPGVQQLVDPADNLARDSIERTLMGYRARMTDGQSMLSDFNRTLNLKTDVGDAAERSGGNASRILGGLNAKLDSALEEASPLYRNANDTYRQHSKVIEAIEAGSKAASPRVRAADNVDAFGKMGADEQAGFRPGYADPLIGRIEAASASPMTNKARPLLSQKYAEEFPAFADPEKAAQMGRRINREQKMFDTMSEALGGSKTANNLADAADMGNFDPEFVSHLSRGNWKEAAFAQLGKMIDPNKTATRAVSDKLAQVLLETDPDKIPDAFKGMLARAKEAAHQKAIMTGIINTFGADAIPRLLGQNHREPLELTVHPGH